MNVKKLLFKTIGVTFLAGVLLTGCNSPKGSASESGGTSATDQQPISVSVVVGAHSNANVISPNAQEIGDRLYQCAYTYGTVSLIRADGKPEEFLKAKIPEPSTQGLSERKLKSIAEEYESEIFATFQTDGMAKVEEVDTLEAIRLAANPLKTVTEVDKYLIIADTGVSTTGYVNFCTNDLFNTPTEEIIQALEDAKAIPDLTSVHVIWLYAGQVAEPQQALSEAQKDKLIEIWTAILEKAGAASIDFRPDSASSTPYTNLPDVSTVNADDRAIDVTPLTKMILDSESVSFVGDQAVFEDENQAKQAISSVAQTLLAHPDNKVYVVGCTASLPGKEAFCQRLSEDRAQAIVNELKDFGVSEEQMVAVGMGNQAPWHLEDLDADGKQIESIAQQNRCVVVLDTQDPEYADAVSSYLH